MKFKKIVCVTLSLIMLMSVTACRNVENTLSDESNPSNVAMKIPVGDTNTLLTDAKWEGDDGKCINNIYFRSDNSFGNHCACGDPLGFSDETELYSYNDSDKTVDLYDCEGELLETGKILYLDETFLIIDIWDSVYTYVNQNGSVPTIHDSFEQRDTLATQPYLYLLDLKDGLLTVSARNYDADAKDNFKLWEFKAAKDISFNSVTVYDKNGKVTVSDYELTEKDKQHLGDFYNCGYFEFNTKGEVSHITFYGEIITQESF